ncbi:MAG: NADH-quinone oxidoreductase subunit L [Thermoflexales bacterium]|nr:NADH-quinone oxidoreductase subunit L [Thermoflexales bacterium]
MQIVFDFAWLMIVFPILALTVNALFGQRMREETVSAIAVAASAAAFVLAALSLAALLSLPPAPHGPQIERSWYTWAEIGPFNLELGVWIDPLSATMALVVTAVGTLIHIYSIGYMHGDSRYRRFFVYLNLFLAFMLTLVLGNSYLMLFVGWEGVGLCSYLLIGFWFEKKENSDAANKAFIVNRIGDFGFLMGIFLIFTTFGSLQFHDVLHEPAIPVATATAVTLLLFVGAAGKSAQIPLYVWLPDAMAGPTPVSALIHAATMVTAGVYMIARSQPLYDLSPSSQAAVAVVGALTALFAATIALAQFDIKKILAYSTISQLGFMISAVGMGAAAAGVFHLATHAFFKALLFLGAGSVIHALEHAHHRRTTDDRRPTTAADEQLATHNSQPTTHNIPFDPNDIRLMGGLKDRLPRTFWAYLVGALALAGVPPLAGFWSKDEILLESFLKGVEEHSVGGVAWPFQLAFGLLLAAEFLTAFYMTRQVAFVFFGAPRTEAAGYARESPPVMVNVLFALAFFAAVAGFANAPLLGIHAFHDFYSGHSEPLPPVAWVLALVSIGVAAAGVGLGWLVYARPSSQGAREDPLRRLGPAWKLLNSKYWVDELYALLIVNPFKTLAAYLADVVDGIFWHDWFHDELVAATFKRGAAFLSQPVDKGIIDAGFDGLGVLARRLAGLAGQFQSGYVRNYALWMFAGVVLIVVYMVLR